MVQPLEVLRVQAAGHPLVMALALAAAISLVMPRRLPAGGVLRSIGPALAATVLLIYGVVAAWYASDPRYADPAEPTMPIIGWLFTLGQPIYHDAGSAERYAHVYGPLAFVAHGLALRLGGATIETSKWLGALAGAASLAATYAALRLLTTRPRALVLTGSCALLYLGFRQYTFWTRPEPLLLLFAALAHLAAVRGRGAPAAVAVGLAAGVLMNLKVTGALYALPALALLAARTRPRFVLVAVAAAAVSASLPFALPNVSLPAYLGWIRLSAQNGLLTGLLLQNLEWAALLLLPVAAAGAARAASERPPGWLAAAVALAAGMIGVAVAAAKPGAGSYHLLPFVPAVACLVAMAMGDRPAFTWRPAASIVAGCIALAALLAVAQQHYFLTLMREARETDEPADVHAYLDAHPGEIVQMAFNGYDRPTFARPELTFRSGLYLIDAPAVQEHQLSGMSIPPATSDAIRTCRAGTWLVPKGTRPFEGPNRYPAMAMAPLFPAAFREAFDAAYAKDGSTRYFDIWRCRR